jgi:hypothetical protein
MNRKFEALRSFLSDSSCHFCIIFRRIPGLLRCKLKWFKAVARQQKSNAEFDELAASVEEMAVHSYRKKRDALFRIVPHDPSGTRPRRYEVLAYDLRGKTPPSDSPSQSWWCFSIGSGPTREAGFVIVAVVAAKNSDEVRDHYIARIQKIILEG